MRPFGRLMETNPSTFENTWRVNAFGAFLCSQQVAAAIRDRGAGSRDRSRRAPTASLMQTVAACARAMAAAAAVSMSA